MRSPRCIQGDKEQAIRLAQVFGLTPDHPLFRDLCDRGIVERFPVDFISHFFGPRLSDRERARYHAIAMVAEWSEAVFFATVEMIIVTYELYGLCYAPAPLGHHHRLHRLHW